jgi:hypothetical protein
MRPMLPLSCLLTLLACEATAPSAPEATFPSASSSSPLTRPSPINPRGWTFGPTEQEARRAAVLAACDHSTDPDPKFMPRETVAYVSSLLRCSSLYEASGRMTEALAMAEKAEKADPRGTLGPEVLMTLLSVHAALKDASKVEELRSTFLSRYPDSVFAGSVQRLADDPVAAPPPVAPRQIASFEPAEAARRLSSADLSVCTSSNGPGGRGQVRATLTPEGEITNVKTIGRFEGTPRGRCIEHVIETIRIVPFADGRAIMASGEFGLPDPGKYKAAPMTVQ